MSPCTYRLTSSADSAMKNPWVAFSIFILLPGLMARVLSLPSSCLTSIANSNNFSLEKHNLPYNDTKVVSFKILFLLTFDLWCKSLELLNYLQLCSFQKSIPVFKLGIAYCIMNQTAAADLINDLNRTTWSYNFT